MAAAIASSVSLGGSHKGQLILVVIIVNHPLPEKSVSPYMSGSRGHEFRKKASPFSDENALSRRFFGHHCGNTICEACTSEERTAAAPGIQAEP